MRVALTGAGGFVGTALVRALVAAGVPVRALARSAEAEHRLRELGAEVIRGELGGGAAPAALVEPGDTLIHAAARVAMDGPWKAFERDTVEGTRDLLRATLPRRPARVVYAGSAAVYAVGAGPGGYAAGRTPERPHRCNAYGRAKLAAERVLRSACQAAGCPWTIVRLGFLYGPGNRALVGPLAPLLRRGLLRVLGRGTNAIATLHVEDAVAALLLAAQHPGAVARIYDVASDERVTQQTFLRSMAEALGLPPPRGRVPAHLAYAAAGALELGAQLAGRTAPFTRAMVGLMAVDQRVDASRIRQELGWRPLRSFAEGMAALRQAREPGLG